MKVEGAPIRKVGGRLFAGKVGRKEAQFTAEILRDDKHIVLVEPTMKERMDEAAEWHKKHFPYDLTEE